MARALVGLAFARLLGPAEVGIFFFVAAVSGSAALVAQAGIDRLALSEVGRNPELSPPIRRKLLATVLASSTLVTVLGLGVVAVLPGSGVARTPMVAALGAIGPLNMTRVEAGILRARRRVVPSLVIGELVSPVARLVAFLALPLPMTATRAAVAYLAGWVVAMVAGVGAAALADPGPARAQSWTLGRPWRAAGPLFVFSVASQLRQTVMAGGAWVSATPVDVGQLGAASRLEQMSLLPTTATRFVVAPELASRHQLPPGVVALAIRTARRSLAVQLPTFAAVFALAPALLGLLGDGFVPAAGLVRILLVGAAINAMTGSTTQTLLMSDQRHRLAATSVAGLGAMVVVAGALAPLTGTAAIAIGAAVAHATIGVVEWWTIRARLGARIDVFAHPPPTPHPPPPRSTR